MRRLRAFAVAAAALLSAGCIVKVDFGTVRIGYSGTRTVIWKNVDGVTQALTVGPITGPAADEFATVGPGQTNLEPGESTTIAFTFRPSHPGPRRASCRLSAHIDNPMPLAAKAREVDYDLLGQGE